MLHISGDTRPFSDPYFMYSPWRRARVTLIQRASKSRYLVWASLRSNTTLIKFALHSFGIYITASSTHQFPLHGVLRANQHVKPCASQTL